MDLYSVKAITATLGGPSTFALSKVSNGTNKKSNETDLVSSYSTLVQRLLLDAFFTGAQVMIDLVTGSNVVKRVYPFEAKTPPSLPKNEYRVSRLATQRMPDGREEHLEVFLVKLNEQEKPYNGVYDPLLQQVLEAAFGRAKVSEAYVLHVEFEGQDIVLLRLGVKVNGSVEDDSTGRQM